MSIANYTLDELYKAEQEFAAAHGLSTDALKDIHDIRREREKELDTPLHRIAAWIAAPVLAGYAGWLAQQAELHKNPRLLGVMRDGRILCRLMKTLFDMPTEEIWLNRSLSMLAAFGCGDDEALINWLVRTRLQPLTRAQAAQKLLGKAYDGTDAKQFIGIDNVHAMLDEWKSSGWLEQARARAMITADRLLLHWQNTIGTGQSPVLLMDFACAGNIQRSLQKVLKAKGRDASVIGLNFITTAGSQWAEKAGCVMHGYLAERGTPEFFAHAYARTPDLLEIFTATPLGAIESYSGGGEPVCARTFLTLTEQQSLNNIQGEIIASAALYHRALGKKLQGDISRCLWGRVLLQPLPVEVQALAEWPIDAGLDGNARRILAPRLNTPPEQWTKLQTAWPAGTRLRTYS